MKKILPLIACAVLLGLIGIFVRLVPGVPIMTISFFRAFFGSLFLLMFLPFIDKKFLQISFSEAKSYAFIGAVMAATFLLFNTSFLLTKVANVYLLSNLNIFFAALLGYALLKEKLAKREIIGLFVAIVGLWFLFPSLEFSRGDFTALLSAASIGYLTVLQRKEKSIKAVFWYMAFAALFLLPFPFIFGMGRMGNADQFGFVVLLGVFSTGLAYLLLQIGLRYNTAAKSSLLIGIITPITSIGLAYFAFHESLSLFQVIGSILLLSTIAIIEFER